MYKTEFFAIKKTNERNGQDYFMGIGSDLRFTECFGDGPYYKINLKETDLESAKIFGWKDYIKIEYNLLYPSLVQTQMCFPYGPDIEEEKGRGKLVGFTIEEMVMIN